MRPLLKNGLLVLGSVLAAFALIELSLAVFAPHKLRVRPYHERYDPVLGWVNKPLKDEGIRFEFARDRFFHVRHNSLGLRGRETTAEKPRGVRRILLVGDSYFWGYGVNDDEVLSAVLQRRLPPAFEVLNGGTTGYGTDQAYLWLKNVGVTYRPDVVVFGFSAANDLEEVATSVRYYTPKPLFMLDGSGMALRNVPVPRSEQTDRKAFGNPRTLFGKLKRFLRYHTHTYQFIVSRLNADPERRLLLINLGLAEEYTTNLGGIPVLTNTPAQSRTIAFLLLRESRKAAEAAGAAFLLVFIPEREEDPSGRLQIDGVRTGVHERNSELSSALSAFARKERMAYLDLLPFARERYRKGVSIYTTDRSDHHWNALGHELVAGQVLEALRSRGYLRP
jgi:lysophospholipase L1-like esterase